MTNHNIIYNTQKDHLIISEYGRNIQNLIYHAIQIEDQKERQEFAEALIDLMYQMNPVGRNNLDYKEKLWRHLFKISDFKINVTPPSGQVPTIETATLGPAKIEYPLNVRKYRHYGHHVRTLIEKAVEMEDEEKKAEFVMVIAGYMKIAYRTWNKEHYVNDEVIKEDLNAMSEGRLVVPEEASIDITAVTHKKRRSQNQGKKQRHHRNNRRRK